MVETNINSNWYSFISIGSLYEYLHSNQKIKWKQRNKFVLEIAQGNLKKKPNQNQI